MSLKTFHLFFIAVSVLLSFGFAIWGVREYGATGASVNLTWVALGVLAGIGLSVYGVRVFKKLRHMGAL